MEELLTVEEVAVRMKVSEETIRIWLQDGKLPGAKIGKAWRVNETDLVNFCKPNNS